MFNPETAEIISSLNTTTLAQLREEAKAFYEANPYPTVQTEAWKYTSLRPVAQLNKTEANGIHNLNLQRLKDRLIPDLEAFTLVFVNGKFQEDLSNLDALPASVLLTDISPDIAEQLPAFKNNFSTVIAPLFDTLTAENTAFFKAGILVHVPENVHLKKPIHCLFISQKADQQRICYRNQIIIDKNAAATIVENYIQIEGNTAYENVLNEISLGEKAHLKHFKLQTACGNNLHINNTAVVQQEQANYENYTYSWSGSLIRNNLTTHLKGQNAFARLQGLYISNSNQLIDNHTFIDHAVPNCESEETYKGILLGSGKGVFNGKVLVRPDAQKTNAYQSNKNLVLGENAIINAKPELEIYADDVKCSHGATVGMLNPNEVFYLMARGISKPTAEALLVHAFANELLNEIPVEAIQHALAAQLENVLFAEHAQ